MQGEHIPYSSLSQCSKCLELHALKPHRELDCAIRNLYFLTLSKSTQSVNFRRKKSKTGFTKCVSCCRHLLVTLSAGMKWDSQTHSGIGFPSYDGSEAFWCIVLVWKGESLFSVYCICHLFYTIICRLCFVTGKQTNKINKEKHLRKHLQGVQKRQGQMSYSAFMSFCQCY